MFGVGQEMNIEEWMSTNCIKHSTNLAQRYSSSEEKILSFSFKNGMRFVFDYEHDVS